MGFFLCYPGVGSLGVILNFIFSAIPCLGSPCIYIIMRGCLSWPRRCHYHWETMWSIIKNQQTKNPTELKQTLIPSVPLISLLPAFCLSDFSIIYTLWRWNTWLRFECREIKLYNQDCTQSTCKWGWDFTQNCKSSSWSWAEMSSKSNESRLHQ